MKKFLDKLLALETESEVLEFKKAENNFNNDKLGQYFSALSNEANLRGKESAWLVFGVLDDKTIFGTRINEDTVNKFKNEIGNHTSPRMTFKEVHRVTTDNGDVLLFEIPKGPIGQVVSWKGHAYGRDGESLVGLHEQERNQIKNQVLEDWSAGIIDKATLNDLDQDAILKARSEFSKKNPNLIEQISQWDDITFLNKSKITTQGKITHAAILLLGKAESEHYINPSTCKISWILKGVDGIAKDYAHYSCPLLLNVDLIFSKIRILKYRYIPDGSMFPHEVDQYDPYLIREALHNCIAHQDYTKGGKINLIEKEDGELIFSNKGEFIPKSIEHVIMTDAPEEQYRNKKLVDSMVSFGMIDTVGSGIKRMFQIQKSKFFPLPEYDISAQRVEVRIIGRVLDINYARKLAKIPNLSLKEILLLDKIAKKKSITKEEAQFLRSKKLIEGRRPNYIISSEIANKTDERADYIKNRGLKDDHYKKMILQYLDKFESADRNSIDKLLFDLLPAILDNGQKKKKISNILSKMANTDKTIKNSGNNRAPRWKKND